MIEALHTVGALLEAKSRAPRPFGP